MDELTSIVVYTVAAGACIPAGAALGRIERIGPRWLENEVRHFVIALGGGALVAAVVLVLIPDGTGHFAGGTDASLVFAAGGFACFATERWLGRRRLEAPQFGGMLLDFVPETLALGGALATGAASAPLLALLIGLQNLPEGFNAYRELAGRAGASSWRPVLLMCALVPTGPLLGLIGYWFLEPHPRLLGAVMLFSAGAILYLIFQDIAPQARLRRHWAPPLGAVIGFSLAMAGNALIAG